MAEAFILNSQVKNPARVVPNSELEDKLELRHGVIDKLTGIKKRYYIDETQSLHSIATDACIEVINNSQIDPKTIDLMIFYTEVPVSYRENSILHKRYYETSAHIQNSLVQRSIDIHCECFNIAGSCVAFISALQIAMSLIKCGSKSNVLIVGASDNSRYLNGIDKNVSMAFGDGAAATIISKREEKGFIDFYRMTNGEGFDAGFFENYESLIIDRKKVSEFGPVAFQSAVREILKKTNLKIDDIDIVIPHQAGERIIRKGMQLAAIPENKVFFCLEHYGNTGAPALQIALSTAIAERRVKKGDLMLLVAFGIGWNYGAAVLRY